MALGTVADMVPLKGQNRILVSSGIQVMKKSRWPGIRGMIAASHVRADEISSGDLAFKLAPRLNAPGRMGDIESGITGLTTDNESVAVEVAKLLNRLNLRRQEIEGNILEDIENNMIPELDLQQKKIMVFAKQGWHQGVLGIVASRLLDRYYRPVLILTVKDGIAVGSGRSIDGFNLHKAMARLDYLFEKYGGHYHAAGCTIKASNIEKVINGLEEIAEESLDKKDIIPSIDIDAEITLKELSMDVITGISSLAPFGKKNPEPLFYVDSLGVINSRIVGENHLKLRVRQNDSLMEAIGFGLAELHPLEGKTINMVFTPEINSWNGFDKIQLRIIDLELKDSHTKLLR